MTSETKKIILVDAIAIAAVALLVLQPALVSGVIIWALIIGVVGLVGLFNFGTPAGRHRFVKNLAIGEGSAILGRISRGEKIL